MLAFLVSAGDGLERTARAIKGVRLTAKATAADLAVLGKAIEQALEATNERLAHLERVIIGGASPGDERTKLAMELLRSAVRRSAERADGGGGPPAAR